MLKKKKNKRNLTVSVRIPVGTQKVRTGSKPSLVFAKDIFVSFTSRPNLPKQDKCGCLDTEKVMFLKARIYTEHFF